MTGEGKSFRPPQWCQKRVCVCVCVRERERERERERVKTRMCKNNTERAKSLSNLKIFQDLVHRHRHRNRHRHRHRHRHMETCCNRYAHSLIHRSFYAPLASAGCTRQHTSASSACVRLRQHAPRKSYKPKHETRQNIKVQTSNTLPPSTPLID